MKILLWIKKEVLHVLPVFLFFLIFFTLISWTESFLFRKAGLTPIHFAQVALAAALIAKIVLVVDHTSIIHQFETRPLAFPIAWKSTLYWVLLLLVRLLIRIVPYFWAEPGYLRQDVELFVSQFDWRLFASVQVFYFMLLFIFVTFQELIKKIGPEKMKKLFFG